MPRSILIVVPLMAALLAGCQSFGAGSAVVATEEPFLATDEPARVGREHFARGNYALAERYFQAAVERIPGDGDAWVGLAASYDQLGRFDLADRAYGQAVQVKGQTVQILNNRGFSYLLRGDAGRAGALFNQARALSPNDPVVVNNIQILRAAPRA